MPSSNRKNRRYLQSQMRANRRRSNFFARPLQLETLEARQVMDGTLHQVAAANINVVQNDNLNNPTSVTVTTPYAFNGLGLRTGSNRGDYNIRIGPSPADDIAGGVLLTSISENGRDNGENPPAGTQYGISAVHDDGANGYFIALHNTSVSGVAAADVGNEYNFNVSAAYFPYSDGWIGGLIRNSGRTNGGANNFIASGSAGLTLGTHIIDLGAGQSTIDLTSMGINSQTDGVLLVNHGKNENNFAMSRANADGTWTVFVKGHNSDGSGYEQDPIAFVYVPLSNTEVIAGKFRGGANNIALQNAPFTVTNPSTGTYHLEIPGQSPSTGVLIISAEGGAGNNVDNPVSFAVNGTGWDIQTRDLPNMGLQNIGAADAVVSFVFIPGPTPGVTVSPTSGLLTSESGATADFSVVLDTQPTADVTINLSSSNPAEGTLSASSLTFTPADWNVPQIVTITGQDDAVLDGAVNYTITTSAASSSDPAYDGRVVADITVTNADNEPGITINPITGLTTTEAGGTAAFNVQLNTAPTADVTFSLTSSDTTEGTIALTSLTFTSANWNTPQVVTITGVNDDVDDGDIAFSISTGPATSADPLYNNLNPADVSVTNTDNDTAGVTLTPTSGLTTTEAGGTATFSIVLTSQPLANVTIGVSSSAPGEGTVSTGIAVFTPANWNTPQTITVTGADDLVRDGHTAYSIVTAAATSTDPAYGGLNADDVAVTNLDNEPLLAVSAGATFYGVGGTPILVDAFATITDVVATNYNNYQLVASLTGGANVNDRLEIRHYGNGPNQVGVSGSNVTFAGTTVGTFAGGNGTTPLAITFNGAATPAIAQAVLRAITFRSVVANPPQITRVAAFTVQVPGGGVSNMPVRPIQVGLMRITDLTEGLDRGFGVYTGQIDIQLRQNMPDVAFPTGGDADGLLVDSPDSGVTNEAQVLLRYNNLFGTGPGQIPLGSVIVSAELLVNVNNPGDAGTLHRMLTGWDENTETWNSFGNGVFPRDANGGVALDDVEARATSDSPWGLADGSGATGTGMVSIGVTNDLVAWSNGEVNHGWVVKGWLDRTDGTAFSPSEAVDPLLRPRLKVTWLPPTVSTGSFRNGVDGYAGTVDTIVTSAQADIPLSGNFTLGVDYFTATTEQQTLLRFDDIIGTGVGQIPPGSQIHAAALVLASVAPDAMGDGGVFHRMLQPWDSSITWNTATDGIQANGFEASTTMTVAAGSSSLNPDVQGGYNPFDVTADVQAWASGASNNGWAILPWDNGSNAWLFGASDTPLEVQRPQLRVYYTAPGITVTPASGLFTSEAGDTSTFTVVLDTLPSADVVIPLSSSDLSEGTVSPGNLTFTPANWNIPQTVTITGVDDALPDGPIVYNILTGPTTSSDLFYNNLDPADVSVTNADNETAGITVQTISSPMNTTEAGGTAQFSLVLNTAPTANVTIGLSSSDTTEGTVPANVVFTPANWSVPQVVTITGVDDNLIDGPIIYTIVTAAATSADPNYNNQPVADVSVTNLDLDVAGITVTPTSGLQTTEAGGTATFTVVLNTVPTANVSIDLTSSNTAEGTVSPSSLTFTPANWNVPRTVTLTGVADAAIDGSVSYTIITSPATSADPNYQGLNPSDVTAANVDVVPIIALPEGPKLYGFGGPAVLVDFQATITDFDSLHFNSGNLTIQSAAAGTADDRYEVRNVGTGPGQIGVSGSTVSFGGAPIGTIAGGVGVAPLVITLNTAATPVATEALLRAVTFRNVAATFSNSLRTVQVTLNDGSGNTSAPVTKSIVIGMRRSTSFREGADVGNGAFAGTADIQLRQANPDTAYPTGDSAQGLAVVGNPTTANSQVLLRFDNIFGNGPGQIPLGAIITSAYLDIDVNNSGNGPVFRRMLQSWNENSSTWNSLVGGVQGDGVEARANFDSTLNTATGNSAATGTGLISVAVQADLQAWANGEANNGWALMPFQATSSDNFIFSPSEATSLADRPRLRVEWIPGGAANNSFRQGVNGYADVTDVYLTQTAPTTPNASAVDLFVDYPAPDNGTHPLIRFDNIIGGVGQIPAGTKVYAAVLTLPGTNGGANTPGDGGTLHTMLTSWDATATWSTFAGDGVQADGTEAAVSESGRIGNENLVPNAQAGFNHFDVTFDVQAWIDGTLANNGWAFLPFVGGSDGWAFNSSEVANIAYRPMLTVYYEGIPNVAPMNSVPVATIAGTEEVNVPFTAGNAISVSDADVGQTLTTTVSVPNSTIGTLTAANGGGTATVTPSNGGATLAISGSQGDVNLALATLVFTPAANVNSAVTVTVATSDGIATDTDTVTINLANVNDAPSFTAVSPPAVNEDAPAQSITGWVTAFNPGPNEGSQLVSSYNVTNVSNPSLFTAGPSVATNGTLSYTLAANAFGTSSFDITVTDNGGNANGGAPTSSVQTFTITVNSVNDAPSFTKGADQNVGFNAGPQTVPAWATAISFGPANEAPQTVTFIVSPSNPALFASGPAIASDGTLTFTPATGASGTATVTVTAQDSGSTANGGANQSAPQTFVINVSAAPANALPTISAIGNVTINEDALLQTINLAGISAGGDIPAQSVTVSVTSGNPALIPTPSVSYTSPNATGTLTFTPVSNLSGTSLITVTVTDSGLDLITGNADDGVTTTTFTITVNAVNDVPSFIAGGTQTVNEDAGPQTVANFATGISRGPADEAAQSLTFNVSNNNAALFSSPPSIAANGTLTYTPAANAFGTAVVTVSLSDNGGTAFGGVDTSATQTFIITVDPINDAPSFTVGPNLTVPFNSLAQTNAGWATGIAAGPANEAGQTLTFNIGSNSNPSLFAVLPAIAANGTLTFTPAPGQQGAATITLNISDDGGTANGGANISGTQSFTITIDAPVNNLPTINPIPTLNISEDASLQTVSLSGITAGGADVQAMQVTASSSNAALIPTPSVSYSSPSSTGTLTLVPAANATGSSVITVTVRDAGLDLLLGNADDGIMTTTFTVNVAAVNDPPDATNLTLNTLVNTPVNSTLPATDVDGPTLTYSIAIPPAIGMLTAFNPATGAFTYTPNTGATGLEIFSFSVTDGTSSDTAIVRITVAPNTPVVTSDGSNVTVDGTFDPDMIIISAANGSQVQVRTQSGNFTATNIYPLAPNGLITVNAGGGNDYIVVANLLNPTLIDAGADDDYVSTGIGDDTVIGGLGNDQINASSGNNTVWGDVLNQQDLDIGGDDVLSSLSGNDAHYGGGGNDQIFPGDGDDYVHAGFGNDFVSTGGGNDRLFGGAGNDILSGDAGDDIIAGHSGNDYLLGQAGNDLLIGGVGGLGDNLDGSSGNDILVASDTTNSASSLAGDANDLALMALLVAWNSSQSAGLFSSVLSADDGAPDSLIGSTGDDDFYAVATDALGDFGGTMMGNDRRFP